ncbi:MAG: hypothetical protein RLZZ142_239, partial [Verrucomicrobiota bacterium]
LRKTPPQRTVFRRMSRVEYLNTIQRQFLGSFQLPVGFPEDTRFHGFDNVAEALKVSPSLLEAYSESAALIADRIFRLPRTAPTRRQAIPIKEFSVREIDLGGATTLLKGESMRFALRDTRSGPASFQAPVSATYRLRLKAAAVHPKPGESLHLKALSGGTHQLVAVTSTSPEELVAEIPIQEGKRIEFEFVEARRPHLVRGNFGKAKSELREQLEGNPRLLAAWLSFHEERTDKDGKTVMRIRDEARPLGPQTDDVIQNQFFVKGILEALSGPPPSSAEKPKPETLDRLLDWMAKDPSFYVSAWNAHAFEAEAAIDLLALEIEGPLERFESPEDQAAKRYQQALLGTLPGQPGEPQWLSHSVERILQKAFRRPALGAERTAYEGIAHAHLAEGRTPQEALNLVLRAALVSPHFLYREAQAGSRLSLPHLASRLSYFLTLGPPDPPLQKAAEDGSLEQSEALRAQALRLLSSPAFASAFAKHFSDQWLGTRILPQIVPAPHLGTFDGRHAQALSKEIEMLCAEILTENRPLTDFIDPDFTFTNFIVGTQIYGLSLPVPEKGENDRTMVRVSLPRGGRRGGLLGMAGTMMATANGVDTQPVIRGKWLLENILGDPPPPPPPSVPAITPDTRGAKTIRDLMAAHTKEESCAGCHRKLDPPGFLLENFDAIGNWRDHYPIHTTGEGGKTITKPGAPVNASATLADGTELRDVSDLKRYLVAHIDQFSACLAEKLFLCGAGRLPDYAERKALRTASQRVLAEGGGFRDLLLAVIDLEAFRR